VTAASEHPALDRERAETYLRLQAEAELRRALTMPEYKPPRDHRASWAVNWGTQARRMRHRRAVVSRLMRQQAPRQGQPGQPGPGGGALQPERRARSLVAPFQQAATSSLAVVRSAAGPLTRQLRGAASHTAGWRHQIANSAWHLRRRLRRRLPRRFRGRGYAPPQAQSCADRVGELAAVLEAVGAISAQTEADVVASFAFALAARSRIEPDLLLGNGWFGHRPMRRRASTPSPPSGPLRAFPVGVFATGQVEGVPIRFYFGVLVNDGGSVRVTIQAKFAPALLKHDHRHMDPMFDALNDISAVDDRGGTYQTDFSGGGGDGNWEGRLDLTPAPPAGLRWLDVALPGASVVRIPMDTPPADLRVTTEAVRTTAGDRLLDAHTAQLMLASATDAAAMLADDTPSLFGMAADLLAAGVVTTTSESLRRLVAAAAHVSVRPPSALAAIEPSSLPADWLSLRARAEREDGPTGIIAVAAVLPEVDGAQCVIGELSSAGDSATMKVHARGWPEPQHRGGVRVEKFEWTARDDLGGSYLLGNSGWSYSDGEADLDLQFTPALDPGARSLDIMLTGATTRVTVTVPLDWQEAA
jgi:hypothetical protein